MMNAIKHVDNLVKSGFTEQQAKASVNEAVKIMNENLASKEDLKDVRNEMSKEFAAVRYEMKTEFAAVRYEMKTEFAAVRHEMKTEFAAVRHEMKTEFAAVRHEMREMESRIVFRLGTIVAASIAVAVGLTSLIQKFT